MGSISEKRSPVLHEGTIGFCPKRAAHLPPALIDAIGGSAAWVYVDTKCPLALPWSPEEFETEVLLSQKLKEVWEGCQFELSTIL
jgi:hypothetical protein